MRNLVVLLTVLFSLSSFAQIEGRWKVVDFKTGNLRTVIQIYKKPDGKFYGRIAEVHEKIPSPNCEKCPGEFKNAPVIGLEIIQGLVAKGNGKWEDGKVIDPESGKFYSCKASLTKTGDLNLRGYLGISLLGRRETWIRE